MPTTHIDYAGYTHCPVIQNADVRVILGPHAGGRILAYELDGENALMLDPAQDGWTDTQPPNRFGLTGGRFDIGPVRTLPKHPAMWLGPWQAELTGDLSVRMTSVVDPVLGVQVVRDIALAPTGTHLRITQSVTNHSTELRRLCHWGRAFGRGHGIAIVPLSEWSRFPDHYVRYGPGTVINYDPHDPAIRRREGYLVVFDTPESAKLGFDSTEGWFVYLMPQDQMIVLKYDSFSERVYGEMTGLTLSLWYFEDYACELEPMGPLEILHPGECFSFTEEWWLGRYPFPQQRDALDIIAAGKFAMGLMSG